MWLGEQRENPGKKTRVRGLVGKTKAVGNGSGSSRKLSSLKKGGKRRVAVKG